jgi:hypothetical protein
MRFLAAQRKIPEIFHISFDISHFPFSLLLWIESDGLIFVADSDRLLRKFAPNEKCEMENFLLPLDAELRPKPKFKSVHLAFISFVIVSAKVQQAMENKLRDFLINSKTIFFGLPRGLLD